MKEQPEWKGMLAGLKYRPSRIKSTAKLIDIEIRVYWRFLKSETNGRITMSKVLEQFLGKTPTQIKQYTIAYSPNPIAFRKTISVLLLTSKVHQFRFTNRKTSNLNCDLKIGTKI